MVAQWELRSIQCGTDESEEGKTEEDSGTFWWEAWEDVDVGRKRKRKEAEQEGTADDVDAWKQLIIDMPLDVSQLSVRPPASTLPV